MTTPDFDEYYGDIVVWIETVEVARDELAENHPAITLTGKVISSTKERLPKGFPMRLALAHDPGDQGLFLSESGGFARWPTKNDEAHSLLKLIELDQLDPGNLGAVLDVADADALSATEQHQHLNDLILCVANLIRNPG